MEAPAETAIELPSIDQRRILVFTPAGLSYSKITSLVGSRRWEEAAMQVHRVVGLLGVPTILAAGFGIGAAGANFGTNRPRRAFDVFPLPLGRYPREGHVAGGRQGL